MTVQSAADLPFGTIVAEASAAVWVKEDDSDHPRPWAAVHLRGAISDADVDAVLQSGDATVVRVGTGT